MRAYIIISLIGLGLVGVIVAPTQQTSPPAISLPVQAIIVSDNDGSRPCPITPPEIKVWIEKADEIYVGAGIRFAFNPDADSSTVRNTLLNNMTGTSDKNWKEERTFGNQVAGQYPGKLAIFFRHGPGPNPSGGGFSAIDYNFVAAPGRVTSVCGYQNVGLLAHEIGHYLGLTHTHAREFKSVAEAETFFREKNNNPSIFDGDGLSDTLPDPFLAIPEIQCQPVPSVTLGGVSFPLPRTNIMSYYEVRTGLSPQQIVRARWFLAARQRNSMAMPTNAGALNPLQAEALQVADRRAVNTNPQAMQGYGDGWYGDKHLWCNFQLRGVLNLVVPIPQAGRLRIDLYLTHAPDFGRFQIAFDGRSAGVYDAYAPGVIPSGRIGLGVSNLTAGPHQLRFECIGKNPASKGTGLGINCIDLVPASQ